MLDDVHDRIDGPAVAGVDLLGQRRTFDERCLGA